MEFFHFTLYFLSSAPPPLYFQSTKNTLCPRYSQNWTRPSLLTIRGSKHQVLYRVIMQTNGSPRYGKRIASFFLISHGMPLVVTALVMIWANSFIISNPLQGNMLYIGFLSPTIAALFVVYRFFTNSERKDYWVSIIDFKRISWRWYLVIICFPLLIRFLAAFLDVCITANEFLFSLSPNMSLAYALFLLPFGPIPEELGWRGVALPALHKKYGFTTAVIILGILWAVWHLPMFFVEGTYQNQLGIFTPSFWAFFLQVLFSSIIYSAVYFETNKSILAVILFHYLDNLTGETFVMTFEASVLELMLRGIIAIGSLVYYRVPVR